jgi:hypothetical protein
MNTESEYYENFYSSNYTEDFNLDIRDKEAMFQEQFYNTFSPERITSSEFVDNFMKIDHNFARVNTENKTQYKNFNISNDSASTHSSLNLNYGTNSNSVNDLSALEETKKELLFLKSKKGRPMTDADPILDEFNDRVYDPDQDPVEYKKARK